MVVVENAYPWRNVSNARWFVALWSGIVKTSANIREYKVVDGAAQMPFNSAHKCDNSTCIFLEAVLSNPNSPFVILLQLLLRKQHNFLLQCRHYNLPLLQLPSILFTGFGVCCLKIIKILNYICWEKESRLFSMVGYYYTSKIILGVF